MPIATRRVITQGKLKRFVSYSPETGQFKSLVKTARREIGDVLGGAGYENEYRKISIDGVQYAAHRLAWIYMTGHQPDIVDHRNGLRHDNRFTNLRDTTQSGNCLNQRCHREGTNRPQRM